MYSDKDEYVIRKALRDLLTADWTQEELFDLLASLTDEPRIELLLMLDVGQPNRDPNALQKYLTSPDDAVHVCTCGSMHFSYARQP